MTAGAVQPIVRGTIGFTDQVARCQSYPRKVAHYTGKFRAKSKLQPPKSYDFGGQSSGRWRTKTSVNQQGVVWGFDADGPVVQLVAIEKDLN